MIFAGWIRRRLAVRIAVQVVSVVLILSAGYIWLQAANAKNAAVGVITAHGEHIGEHFVKRLDVGQLEEFLDQPEENETYWAIRDELDRFRTEIGALYVYIFRADEDAGHTS
jgi:methyl-accepting chemotaxis protein